MQHARYHRILQPYALSTCSTESGDNDDAICGACGNFGFWRVVIITHV